MKSLISALVANFSCFNIAIKFSFHTLSNSRVAIYLAWS